MRGNKYKYVLVVLFAALILSLMTLFVHTTKDIDDITERDTYGFPMAIVERDGIGCDQHPYRECFPRILYQKPRLNVIGSVVDIAFWSIPALLVLAVIKKRRKQKNG